MMRSIAPIMCWRRSLSLSGSLINQFSVSFNTFTGKGGKRSFCDQIHVTSEQVFQVLIHAEEFKPYGLAVVKYDKYIHIAVRFFFATGVGTKQPCLQDGFCLEIVSNYIGHSLCTHRRYLFDFKGKLTTILWKFQRNHSKTQK